MTNQKSKELSDKVDFPEPNAQNVQVGDYLAHEHYEYETRFGLIREIMGVSKISVLVRGVFGQNIIGTTKEGKRYGAGQRVKKYGPVVEVKFEDAIVLKRDGTYLIGRNVNIYMEKK